VNDDWCCAQVDDVAVDLALGTLTGDDRARALAHLDSCAPCRRKVDGFKQAADALLLLAPDEQPPLGFESRVATGIEASTGSGRRPRRWRRLAVAAAVAAGTIGGVVAGHLTAPAPSSLGVRVALAAADGGKAVCRAVVIPGSPSQLVVTIDEHEEMAPTDYVVEAELAKGSRSQIVGSLQLADGHGALSAPLPAGGDNLRSVRVFQSGQLRYEARFQ